jgi:Arc/MetJ-type ribon-helix-helix transcriptional regulator
MSVQIAIRIPEDDLEALDDAIARGAFASRAAAVRAALEALLRDERRRRIEEADQRGYGDAPQGEWVGEVGLAAFAALVEAEERDEEPL